jgi:hypothetical protein
MSPMPWFRVYSEILNDRKIDRICKRTSQSKALIIGVWICLLALANDSDDRGTLLIAADLPFTPDDLADITKLPIEIVGQLLDEFRSHGMINGHTPLKITNWSKRQFKSDDIGARVKKHRVKRYGNVTHLEAESGENIEQMKRFGNVVDSDSESESDSESDSESEVENIDNDDGPNPTTAMGQLEQAFVLHSKISHIMADPKTISAYSDMVAAGVQPEDIQAAIDVLDSKGYSVSGPWSIVHTAITEMRRRTKHQLEKDPRRYITGEFSQFVEH